jgi:predicted dithiol-disulfide oxidoreductase (DUF899 family)
MKQMTASPAEIGASMSLPDITSRDQWLEARKALLEREKAMTHARDVLNADRRRLPMVRIEKNYEFTGPDGALSLLALFDGQHQLVLQHFMFDPSWDDGCSSCTADCDEISAGQLTHLRARDTNFVVIARAPYPKMADYKARRGWAFPYFSSFGSDFNYDFHATIDETVAPLELHLKDRAEIARPENHKLHWVLTESQPFEMPGYSFFLRDGDQIFLTNYVTARGTESLGDSYAILDHTALGRQEDWEEPKGRAENPGGANPDFAT